MPIKMASLTLPRHAALISLRQFAPVPATQASTTSVLHSCRSGKGGFCCKKYRSRLLCNTQGMSSQSAPQEQDFFDKAILKLYEKETPIISLLLEEVDEQSKIENAVEDISGEVTTESEKREIVKRVVDKHWEELTEAIIMVLAGYAQASYTEGHVKVAETLELIREEILAKSLKQLPPEMQALEHLIGMFETSRGDSSASSCSEERVAAIKELCESGRHGISECELPALRTTASQMLEDMEEKRGVIDAELLAKLCIIREEIDVAATDLEMYEEGTLYFELMSTTWRLLPAGNAAFVKELMRVSDATRRRALLTACIKHDFQDDPTDTRMQAWVVQGVRPGRLMNTIAAIMANLRSEGIKSDSREFGRLQEIKVTAMELLQEMAA